MYEINNDGLNTTIKYNGVELKDIKSLTVHYGWNTVEATMVVMLPITSIKIKEDDMVIKNV